MTSTDREIFEFIQQNTEPSASTLTPAIRLNLATELTPLWHATEAFLQENNLSPPFWAFAWPGGEALAHHITHHPEFVAGKRVLDFAAGCGLAGIAARKAGAEVDANDIDPFALAAIKLNSSSNNLKINIIPGNIVGQACVWDVILCGDVCYEAPMTQNILPWLHQCAQTATVIIADPGRKYAPTHHTESLATYEIPTSLELETTTSRTVTLFRLLALA